MVASSSPRRFEPYCARRSCPGPWTSRPPQYLRFQHLLGTTTFHEGIRLLPAATVGTFSLRSGNWSMRKYWDWDHIAQRPEMTFDEATEEASTLLRGAVQTMSRGALRPGVFLSGGLDSRALVGFLAESHPAPATATFGVAESRDVYYAARIARAVGSRHHWFDLPDGRSDARQPRSALYAYRGLPRLGSHARHGHSAALREVLNINLTAGTAAPSWATQTAPTPSSMSSRPRGAGGARLRGLVRSSAWPGLTRSQERLLYARRSPGC